MNMTSSECKLPVTRSAGREALFDIHSSTPGDFVHPVLFDDETWEADTDAEMSWIFFKGDPASEPTEGHPFDMPFSPSTLFSIDFLDSANVTFQNVMPPTNSTPFWDAGSPFGRADGKHMLTIPRFANRSCPTNTFGLMIYRWTVPAVNQRTASSYRLRLSTNDSDWIHYSGEVTIRAQHASYLYPPSHVSCGYRTLIVGGTLVLGMLAVLGWIYGSKILCRRLVQYRPLDKHEKNVLP